MTKMPDPFRLLLDGIADYAVFTLDIEGHVSRWTISASKMLGYEAEEIQGKHFSAFYPSNPEDQNANNDELAMAAAHGRFEDIGWRLRRDKSKFWADSVICPFRGEDGELLGYSLLIRDLTERKKAEEALRQKETELTQARKMEAVGRLAGGIAHDFNNFITGIMGLAEELRTSMTEQDPRREDLEEILRTADQARALTRELLAFGRKQISAPQVIDLNTILKDKQRLLMRLVGADIQLHMDLDPASQRILIDPTQLDQILINMVMNARDAMPQGGAIRFQTAQEGSRVCLTIQDDGCGMDSQVLSQVFEPFFTTKDQGKGTGLGLASVYGIVKQNQGDIQVESQPGRGTTFRIQFPGIDVPATAPAPTAAPSLIPGVETVLVVEDTAIVQRVVTQALKKAGYRVHAATSGAEAIAFAQKHPAPIDLILTDMIMPEMNGPEVVVKLRQIHPEAAIILMSAYAAELVQEKGFLNGKMDFIEKPFTHASLLNKVREVLDKRTVSASTASLS